MRRGRREILEEHGLSIAPSEEQRLFWDRYNKRRLRPAVRVGDLLDRVTKPHMVESADVLSRVRGAWRSILPETFAGRTHVEGLTAGRLRVVVCSSADRYALGRQAGEALIEAMNDTLRSKLVKRIDYRVGAVPREKTGEEASD